MNPLLVSTWNNQKKAAIANITATKGMDIKESTAASPLGGRLDQKKSTSATSHGVISGLNSPHHPQPKVVYISTVTVKANAEEFKTRVQKLTGQDAVWDPPDCSIPSSNCRADNASQTVAVAYRMEAAKGAGMKNMIKKNMIKKKKKKNKNKKNKNEIINGDNRDNDHDHDHMFDEFLQFPITDYELDSDFPERLLSDLFEYGSLSS